MWCVFVTIVAMETQQCVVYCSAGYKIKKI